jgi:hypothetical protein
MAAVVNPESCVALSLAMLAELNEAISDEVSRAMSEDFNPVIEAVELTEKPPSNAKPKQHSESSVSGRT